MYTAVISVTTLRVSCTWCAEKNYTPTTRHARSCIPMCPSRRGLKLCATTTMLNIASAVFRLRMMLMVVVKKSHGHSPEHSVQRMFPVTCTWHSAPYMHMVTSNTASAMQLYAALLCRLLQTATTVQISATSVARQSPKRRWVQLSTVMVCATGCLMQNCIGWWTSLLRVHWRNAIFRKMPQHAIR